MLVRFPCPNCGKWLKADSAEAGRKGSCRACGSKFVVPDHNVEARPKDAETEPLQATAAAASFVKSQPIAVEDFAVRGDRPAWAGALLPQLADHVPVQAALIV